MNNRIPIAILAFLVLVALIWRIANPPAPPPPGPLGMIPAWDSQTKVGDMSASAVNPSGTMWAGAWNQKTRSGKLRSALLIIDLENQTASRQSMKPGSLVTSLGWRDDDTIWALLTDSDEPEGVRVSRIVYVRRVGSDSPKIETTRLKEAAARIMAWPVGSDKFAAQLAGTKPVRFAVLTDTSQIIGKVASLELAPGTSVRRAAAISPDGKLFVISVAEDKIGGKISYFLANSDTGVVKKTFSSTDLPGRVEGMWVSATGVLMVCADRERLQTVIYRLGIPNSKPVPTKEIKDSAIDIAKSWPDAPRTMMFATYNGGYELKLASGRVKRLFDLTKLGRESDHWRRQIQDGRLYKRKDGDYTAVSVVADEVDIRVVKKSGEEGPEILPRS
ncbi:MAG: hypothetical protein N3B12_01275 [Armatimonadetes bacterium]|nr:hypothetical protein [Armatimonadota bacterium]